MVDYISLAKKVGFYEAVKQFELDLFESYRGTSQRKMAKDLKLAHSSLRYKILKCGFTSLAIDKAIGVLRGCDEQRRRSEF